MIPTAEQLENTLAFESNKIEVARTILEASYKLAEEGADEQQLLLLRRAANLTLDAEIWEMTLATPMPCYKIPMPCRTEDQPF